MWVHVSVVPSICCCTYIAFIALLKLPLTAKVSVASYINLGLAISVGYVYINFVYVF